MKLDFRINTCGDNDGRINLDDGFQITFSPRIDIPGL